MNYDIVKEQSSVKRFDIVKRRYVFFYFYGFFHAFAGQYLTYRMLSTHTSLVLPKERKLQCKIPKRKLVMVIGLSGVQFGL